MNVSKFMKVMNGLVMTNEEDKRFLCVWRSFEFFFYVALSVFSSSEVLAKITSIWSKLLTVACWSREEKRGNCEANLL